jgi:hypothetical protein
VHDADESVSAAALADEYMRASTMCPGCGQMREVTEDGFVSHHTAYNGVDGPLCGGDDMAAVHMINSDGADQMSVTFEPSDTVAPSTTTEATDATEATPDIP